MEYKVYDSLKYQGEFLEYIWNVPNTYKERLPLIIYIHGAGCRGDDITKMPTSMGPIGEIKSGRQLDAIVAMPQCRCNTWFEVFPILLEFIDEIRHHSRVDISRVYLCGASMGGYTTWQIGMARPEWFAAMVPVCGGGMYWNAERLKNMPIWAFHGADDATVLPTESVNMVEKINSLGGNAKLTIYPNVGHASWVNAFAEDEMWKWLFEQSR